VGVSAPRRPPGARPAPGPPAAEPAGRSVMARRASSFTAAARLLAPALRDDVELAYGVFRSLDDLVDDGAPDAASRVAAVAAWATSASGPMTPETQVLDRLARRHPIPRDAVADFCAGMRHDLAHTGVPTERDVDRYCYRVAGTVGLVMAALLGAPADEETRACAISLGIAMQRTNILRDIDEDAAAGRIYISDEARARHGWSLRPGERAALVRAQIARADELYDDGLMGLHHLREGRAAIALAAGLYREILREIERSGLGRRPGRVVVAAPRKIRTALRVTLAGR
jgi:15-cis-phytoene synthase